MIKTSSSVGDFTGIKLLPRIRKDRELIPAEFFVFLIQGVAGYDDQICLTRKTGVYKQDWWGASYAEEEVVSTGITKAILDRFVQKSTTDEENKKVKEMLEFALNQDLTAMSKSLSDISKLLITPGCNIEVIKKILLLKNSVALLSTLAREPELLNTEKVSLKLWNKILNLSSKILSSRQPDYIFRVLGKHPDLLYDANLTPTVWDQILRSKEPSDILNTLGQCYQLRISSKLPILWDRILKSHNPSSTLGILGKHPELLKNAKITDQYWGTILKQSCPWHELEALAEYPDLLMSPKLISLWDKILKASGSSSILRFLGEHPELLKNTKITDQYWNTILKKSCPWHELEVLAQFPDLLMSPKLTTKLWDEILKSSRADRILRALGEYPDLLKCLSSELSKILSSKDPAGVLEAFGKHPDLLKSDKLMTLWVKILSSKDPAGILEALGKYPDLLQSTKITALFWDTILKSSKPGNILTTLGEHPDLLQNAKLTSKLLGKILSLSNSHDILKVLGEYPDLLKNDKLTPALWDELLSSIKPYKACIFLNKHFDLLKNGHITAELLVKIGKCPKAINVLNELGGFAELMKDAGLWKKMLDSKKPLSLLGFLSENRKYGKYITISPEGYSRKDSGEAKVYLNRGTFLNDETMDLWNILTQREDEIDDDDWDIVQVDLSIIFDSIYQGKKKKRDLLFKFLGQCMGTADALTLEGKQVVRKRVAAVVDVLTAYIAKMNNPGLSTEKQAEIKTMVQSVLDLMVRGGASCPDNAIVLLRRAENQIKLFEYPNYLANVIVNMFKLDAIAEWLTDSDDKENVEAFLSYTFKLNNVLGLGVTGAMLYPIFGKKKTEPFAVALPKLSAAFTEENLINYAVQLEEFRAFFETEKDKAVQAKQEEYLEAYDEYQDVENEKSPETQKRFAKTEKLNQEIEDIKNSFYANKARQIFLKAGFFVTKKC